MKKIIYLGFISASMLVIFGAWVQSDNGKAGYANSPSEGNCTTCHSDFGVNSGSGTIYMTSNLVNGQYTPGQTYTFNVIVKQMSMGLFGVDVECLTTTNANAGTLIITDAVKTQIKTKTIGGVVRNNVVHQLDGGLSPDSAVFTFNWTAPATNIGDAKVYFSGIACDADAGTGGDYVYVDSVTIPYLSPAAINEVEDNFSVFVYPNPTADIVNLNYRLTNSSKVIAQLMATDGRVVQTLYDEMQGAGNVSKTVTIQAGLTKGYYYIKINAGSSCILKKIVVY